MPYEPFKNICEYYLDYIIEDSTDTLSAFANGNYLSYITLNNPEISSRENNLLFPDETQAFQNLYARMTAGNQTRAWWYGFPTLVKFITTRDNRQFGFVKPLFVMYVDTNYGIPTLLPTTPRINNEAFRDLGLDLEQIRSLADDLELFSDEEFNSNLSELTNTLRELFPNMQIADLNVNQSFAQLPYNNQTVIYNKGIIFATESSKITQGLEKELTQLKMISQTQIQNSSLVTLFPELGSQQIQSPAFNLSEAIELNEQQKETVLSAFRNRLTVVTGPPGTGKSQVVASIVINAAKNGQRVLVASKNHKAVDVVEERLNQFVNRPFIIRLGRRGADDRNIQQELIQYLNSLLGTAPDRQINEQLNQIQQELQGLFNIRKSLIQNIEDYRTYRNNLLNYSKKWEEILLRRGKEKAKIIFEKCQTNSLSLIDKIKLLFLKDWKDIQSYTQLLNAAKESENLETLTSELTRIELQIRAVSKNEFILWLNDLPTRLDGAKRQTIAEFVSVLQQIIAAGQANTARNIWARLFSNRDRLMQTLSGFLPAWCVTNLSAKGQLPLIEGFFDLVVIDEASQCDIASALPLMYRSKRAVIIGDPNQLTHISTLPTARSLELMHNHNLSDTRYSVFEATQNSLYRLGASRIGDNRIIMLNEHFRSHERIIAYSNRTWYGGNLEIGTDYNRLNPVPVEGDSIVEWINVVGNIQQVDGSGAFINSEVNAVVQKVNELILNYQNNITLGVVTPFRLQANKIRQALINHLPDNVWTRTQLLVDTAVKFQGDERDIMIFSPVVTPNMPRGIRYYLESEFNLLNVAITRARARLIVIGNLNACLNCGIPYIQNYANYVINLQNPTPTVTQGDGRFESPFEEILYRALLRKNIRTIPQYQFDQYRLDLAYINNDKKIDIEVDGVAYHTNWTGERLKQDIIRNRKLQKKGWEVLRFWSYEIRDNLDYCISKIIKTIN